MTTRFTKLLDFTKLLAAAVFVLALAYFLFFYLPALDESLNQRSRSECRANVSMLFRGSEIIPQAGSHYKYYVSKPDGSIYSAVCFNLFDQSVTFTQIVPPQKP